MANTTSKTTNKKEQNKTKQINPLTLEAIPLILLQRAKKHPEKIALKVKNNGRFQDITWAEYGRKVSQTAAGLLELGLERGEKLQ